MDKEGQDLINIHNIHIMERDTKVVYHYNSRREKNKKCDIADELDFYLSPLAGPDKYEIHNDGEVYKLVH